MSPFHSASSVEQMRSIVDHVLDGIITIDAQGTIVTFNPAAERIFGYGAAEVLHRNVRMLMPDPDRSRHDGYIANYLRTGQPKIIGSGREVTGRRKDGRTFPMELAISEFSLNEDRYFTGIVRDITERKRAEQERRDTEEEMRSVVDNVLDGIITIDESGDIRSFNPAAERIFGYARGQVLGRNVKMLMPEPYHGEHDGYIENYRRTNTPKIIGIGREVVGRRRDGSTFPMELAVSEFHLNNTRFYTGIVRDITERKKLEDQLTSRLDDLAQADRQKNEFLAMLGHELRNPLAPMRNALYVMRMAKSDAAMVEDAQAMIERQLQHMVRLVDDLLDVSRIIRGKIELRRERTDLREVVRRAMETVQPVVDANGHVLDVSLPPIPVLVMGDLVRLGQVVSNLINNAAKYSTRPGRIGVSLVQAADKAVLTVSDEGEGIPPDLLPHVFDLFVQGQHTLPRSQGGLGIGLTLARRLVEMHGGVISASSRGKGLGSEFLIQLPVLPAPRAAERSVAAPTDLRAARRRILVVDDNADAAVSICKVLGLFGHDVRCVYDGPSGLAAADEFQPQVVVLDIGLPGMDGYEVARRLRQQERFREVPLIALTGYGQEEDRRAATEAGFDHHCAKPVDPELLLRLVAEAPGLRAA